MDAMIPTMSTFQITLFILTIFLVIFIAWRMWRGYMRNGKPISSAAAPLHFPYTIPPSQRDPEMIECSMNVIIVDEEGMMFIGFYEYDDMGWVFMHDKAEPQGAFVWMYKPENFKV